MKYDSNRDSVIRGENCRRKTDGAEERVASGEGEEPSWFPGPKIEVLTIYPLYIL